MVYFLYLNTKLTSDIWEFPRFQGIWGILEITEISIGI